MKTMKKSMAFFLSFIVTVIFITFFTILLDPILKDISKPSIKNTILPFLLSLGLIFFMFFQGFLKWNWNKKILKKNKELIRVKGDNFTKTEKLWIYIFLIFIYFGQVFKELFFTSITIEKILLFVSFFIIVHFLLKFSEKTMEIILLKNGVMITGLDLRVDIPLGQPLNNPTGFYPYANIDGYIPLQDKMELFLELEQGKITVHTKGKERSQILYILKENGVEKRKYV
ncbi:hypothetical protein [Anaerosalibacter massiliensis]|uniref:Uncharacterized protein n=1 Tax=Anaerosalibacter massiliensis TaxID=1347392 RepID=A0A9X2MI53_9FIRM|nr:hypothetical protein [Anaerosalibacter massiliensis]MCR2043958.1 hypothetical protein [Anaerosalibacter massiliensis]